MGHSFKDSKTDPAPISGFIINPSDISQALKSSSDRNRPRAGRIMSVVYSSYLTEKEKNKSQKNQPNYLKLNKTTMKQGG